MPMQLQPQSNTAQATQNMLQQSKAPALKTGQINVQPQTPQQGEAPQEGQEGGDEQDNFDQEILENLEQHLNQIDPRQKQFLASSLQHYSNIVIPVLGIVCGQEVMDYFLNIYKQNFAKGLGQNPAQQGDPQQVQQPNSAPAPQGQAPNQAAPQQMPQQAPAQAPAQSQ